MLSFFFILKPLEEKFMERTEIRALYAAPPADGTTVTVCGWARTVRDS